MTVKYPIDDKRFIDTVISALTPFETASDFTNVMMNVNLGVYSYSVNDSVSNTMYDEAFPVKGWKATILISSDFPTVETVQNGWQYVIGANVVDNDPTKTNTGQTLSKGIWAWDAIESRWLNIPIYGILPVFTRYGHNMELITNSMSLLMDDINAAETIGAKQAVITAAIVDINAQK
jgi:hypothetical protein